MRANENETHRVIDLGKEADLRGSHRVLLRQEELELEKTTCHSACKGEGRISDYRKHVSDARVSSAPVYAR